MNYYCIGSLSNYVDRLSALKVTSILSELDKESLINMLTNGTSLIKGSEGSRRNVRIITGALGIPISTIKFKKDTSYELKPGDTVLSFNLELIKTDTDSNMWILKSTYISTIEDDNSQMYEVVDGSYYVDGNTSLEMYTALYDLFNYVDFYMKKRIREFTPRYIGEFTIDDMFDKNFYENLRVGDYFYKTLDSLPPNEMCAAIHDPKSGKYFVKHVCLVKGTCVGLYSQL